MRLFLSRVRGILTDFGAEHLIPDMPDILPAFFETLHIRMPANCKEDFLFPNCVPSAGWHHVCDGLVLASFATLLWWRHFLKGLKCMNSFCRNHLTDVCELLTANGFDDVSVLLLRISFTTFAAWRWRKIRTVCETVWKALNLMRQLPIRELIFKFLAMLNDSGESLLVKQCLTCLGFFPSSISFCQMVG